MDTTVDLLLVIAAVLFALAVITALVADPRLARIPLVAAGLLAWVLAEIAARS